MDAVDDLSDAIDATRELLLPVRAGRWLKLAIVVFFLGGGLGTGGGFSGGGGDPAPVTDDQPAGPVVEEIPDEVIAMAAVLVAIVVVLWLGYRLIGAIMEFVFIESLRSREVRVRRYFGANVGRGLRLFGFRVVTGLLVLGLVGGPALFFFLNAPTVDAALTSLVPLLLLGLAVYFVYAIVMRFTSEFVAPIMLLEDRSVLGAWRRFWGTLTGNWTEYLVYLVLVWILQLVVGIAAGFVVLFGAAILAIPFVILGMVALALGELGVWLAALVAVVGVVTLVLFASLVQMPIRTYFQYYALLLLGDTNADLDLVPEQRAAIRAGEGGPNASGSDSSAGDRWAEDDETGGAGWDDDSSGWDDRDEDGDDRDRGW